MNILFIIFLNVLSYVYYFYPVLAKTIYIYILNFILIIVLLTFVQF